LPRVLNKAAVPAFEIAAQLCRPQRFRPSLLATKPVIGFGTSVGPGPPPRNWSWRGRRHRKDAEDVSFFVCHCDCHRAIQR
jgi:hypothetical protein